MTAKVSEPIAEQLIFITLLTKNRFLIVPCNFGGKKNALFKLQISL
jgi:hypothetical protein